MMAEERDRGEMMAEAHPNRSGGLPVFYWHWQLLEQLEILPALNGKGSELFLRDFLMGMQQQTQLRI